MQCYGIYACIDVCIHTGVEYHVDQQRRMALFQQVKGRRKRKKKLDTPALVFKLYGKRAE